MTLMAKPLFLTDKYISFKVTFCTQRGIGKEESFHSSSLQGDSENPGLIWDDLKDSSLSTTRALCTFYVI